MERKVTFIYCDIDGTQNIAPWPVKTGLSLLLKGKLSLPSPDKPLKPAKRSNPLNYWSHRIRPFTANSEQGLMVLQEAIIRSDNFISLGILSGRDPGLHDMTIEKFCLSGRIRFFNLTQIQLCDVNSSSGFKEHIGKKRIEEGASVILIDDDAKAALMFSRLSGLCSKGQIAESYLLSNITNGSWMLRNTKLPDNVRRVPSFLDAATDIAARIRAGSI